MQFKYKIPTTLGYIRHNPNNHQPLYYKGSIYEHEYDFPVTEKTTIKDLTCFLGSHGPAFEFFANIWQEINK